MNQHLPFATIGAVQEKPPRFTTVIPTQGPDGNIYVILANATGLMRQLGIDDGEIDALRNRVLDAESYQEACGAIREWFPLERDNL